MLFQIVEVIRNNDGTLRNIRVCHEEPLTKAAARIKLLDMQEDDYMKLGGKSQCKQYLFWQYCPDPAEVALGLWDFEFPK